MKQREERKKGKSNIRIKQELNKKCLKREAEKMKEKRKKNRKEKTTKTRKKFKIWRNRIKVVLERKVVREKNVEQKKGKYRKR